MTHAEFRVELDDEDGEMLEINGVTESETNDYWVKVIIRRMTPMGRLCRATEGAAFSAYSTGDFPSDAIAVVRYLSQDTGSHVYSTSAYEQGMLDRDRNWINEGIAWHGDPMA